MRPKRPASLGENSHRSSPSFCSEGGAATDDDPLPLSPMSFSSSDRDPGTPAHHCKIVPLSSVADLASSPAPTPNKRSKTSPLTASASAISRRSDRKRKPRELFSDASPGPRRNRKQQKHQLSTKNKVWAEADEIMILREAIAYHSRTGDTPRQANIGTFFESVKAGISPSITLEQVGYKLKRLKSKYIRSLTAGKPSTDGATVHDTLVSTLSSMLWDEEAKQAIEKGKEKDSAPEAVNRAEDGVAMDEEGEEEDMGEEYPFLREEAKNQLKCLGNCNAFVSNGLKMIDPAKGKALEEKFKKQCAAETLLRTNRLDLLKELSQLLVEANRSSKV